MAKVTLRCGMYTEGSVFSVDIERDADVEALQKKIAGILSTEKNRVPPRLLTLYLARKKGEGKPVWMKHDHNTESFLLGDVDSGYDKMLSSSVLDEDYFGSDFQPGRKEIHVLVKLRESKLPALSGDRQFVVGDVSIPVTMHAVLNPAPLVAFWKALVNNRTEVKAGALIELPEGTYLLGNETLGSRIYIRSCYPKLWELCQQRIHDEVKKTPHLVILGNPGIGKTFFWLRNLAATCACWCDGGV